MNWFNVVGWLGNACFFSRFLVQWWASERAKQSVAPRVFWWLSSAGAVFGGVYSMCRHEPVMLAGFAITSALYVRNLFLAYGSRSISRENPWLLMMVALAGAAALIAIEGMNLRGQFADAPVWVSIGVVGQALWSSRFLVQWYASERAGESHFPRSFWYLSLAGNVLLLAYACHLADPVYVAGFVFGPLVQVRNLMLSGGLRPARADA